MFGRFEAFPRAEDLTNRGLTVTSTPLLSFLVYCSGLLLSEYYHISAAHDRLPTCKDTISFREPMLIGLSLSINLGIGNPLCYELCLRP